MVLSANVASQMEYVSDGVGVWYAINGNFAGNFSSNGYQKLPSGLIIQWGGTASVPSGSNISVTYPIAFPNAALSVSMTPAVGSNIGIAYGYGASLTSASAFTAYSFASGGGLTFRYTAIGY
jgi:hypothetical protein